MTSGAKTSINCPNCGAVIEEDYRLPSFEYRRFLCKKCGRGYRKEKHPGNRPARILPGYYSGINNNVIPPEEPIKGNIDWEKVRADLDLV